MHPSTMPVWMPRWLERRAAEAPSSQMSSRVEVCPPELFRSSMGWRGTLRHWLRRLGWPHDTARPTNRLSAARSAFLAQLADLPGDAARGLTERIGRARSLRELWHLRMATYGVVARSLDQSEAERRLAELNRHFPTRTARTPALTVALPRTALSPSPAPALAEREGPRPAATRAAPLSAMPGVPVMPLSTAQAMVHAAAPRPAARLTRRERQLADAPTRPMPL